MKTPSYIAKYTLLFLMGISSHQTSHAQSTSDKALEIAESPLEVKKETSMAVIRELVLQSIMRNPELAQAEAEALALAEAVAALIPQVMHPDPPSDPIPVPEPRTVANALAHRRTIRKSKSFSREKTRKLLAHSTKKK